MLATSSSRHDHRYDAIVIGAGVIGAAVGYELARRGRRTLNIDKLPAAGYGSTSNSCAIIRFSYSTYDGVAMSWEGRHYWADWAGYLGGQVDERGLARFVQCGTALLKKPDGGHHEKVIPLLTELGIPFEDWSLEQLLARFPAFDGSVFGPPKRPDDDEFWAEPTEHLSGAVWTGQSGYISDPQLSAHNLQRAAEAVGGRFRFATEVTAITTDGGRVTGVEVRPAGAGADTEGSAGETLSAPVVVNVAGPHSFVINRMAGLDGTMKIGTRALRHEVHHVASPPGVNYEATGCHVQDGDTGIYIRPEAGDNILIGSEDPECDPREWVEDPDTSSGRSRRPSGRPRCCGWPGGCRTSGCRTSGGVSSTSTTSQTTGSRSTTRPTSAGSTWPSVPAGISTRTPGSPPTAWPS